MISSIIVRIVDSSTRRAWLVLAIAALLTLGAGWYAARHFAINTDTNDLIDASVPWRQTQMAFDKAFPDLYQRIIVLIEAKTPELAQSSADRLTGALKGRTDVVKSLEDTQDLPFFRQNGLLFQPLAQVRGAVSSLTNAQPILNALSADPSQLGLMKALDLVARGIGAGAVKPEQFSGFLDAIADAYRSALANKAAFFSWQSVLGGGVKPAPEQLRRILNVEPVLDFHALEPGAGAERAIRKAAADLGLDAAHGVRVRLTGDVAISDSEFSTVSKGAWLNNSVTILIVATLMWLALKSPRIVLGILTCVAVGLAITAALGLALVGALNPISVAFAVLFVGIGADFGIQFSVRYRAERFQQPDLRKAISLAGARAGRPLALAAAATACGFYSFLPTVYRGVSELGLIAGTGMMVAFVASITLLPAMLTLLNPPPEGQPIGYTFLAPADAFIARHRFTIVGGALLAVIAASPLLLHLRFDFNTLNLNNANEEAVVTLKDLMRDPLTTYNAIDVVAADPKAASDLAGRLSQLPEVGATTTLQSFVPTDQAQKLATIGPLAGRLEPMLSRQPAAAPSDDAIVAAMTRTSSDLVAAVAHAPPDVSDPTRRFAELLDQVAKAPPQVRTAATDILIPPLEVTLTTLRDAMKAGPVALDSLPPSLRRQWQTPEGRTRIQVAPKGDPNDNAVIRRFTSAVVAVSPNAAGAPIAIQGAGDTIVRAFVEAGLWALLSISVLLYIVLRRVADVLLTLIPLMLAGAVTLEIAVAIGLPLNFANIIALPLLLGLGVAFKIYFVMAWRAGVTNLLQSSLTRAVFFSALVTATAFGSLWMSNNPGTSSMGELLVLSLLCTLSAAVLFQPALMGPPRAKEGEEVI
jgi:hopanoid biosynthesis associated RND transporter like protein HpnN